MTNPEALPSNNDALRRDLEKLRAAGPWTHDIVDLTKGHVVSDVLSGPLTPALRSRRLADFSHIFDGSIFGGPVYRMSSRKPFQETPLAWMHVSSPAFYTAEVEFIAWAQRRNPGTERGFIHFHFDEPPQGKCMATISISASPWAGATGGVTLSAHGASVTLPVAQPVNRAIDVVFTPTAGGPADVVTTIEAGVQTAAFFFMTLGSAPLVFTPA